MPLEKVEEEEMTDSILTTIKLKLGIVEEDDSFDETILTDINSAFMILEQLGVGPAGGFMIEDSMATWNEFLPEGKQLELVKTYMYLKVRLMFDPPASSTILDSFQRQINEFEWRLNVAVDPAHEEEIQNG